MPAGGYLWIGVERHEFELGLEPVQSALQHLTGGQLVDLHVSDLLNPHLPSHFDYTSLYELLVFRRLAAGDNPAPDGDAPAPADSTRQALDAIDTNPVGFAVFDRVLLTVHPSDCQVREFFAARLAQMVAGAGLRNERRGDPRASRCACPPARPT